MAVRPRPLAVVFAALPAAFAASASRAEPARSVASASASTSASAAPVDPRSKGFAPDPVPLVTRKKWVYEIIWDHGAIFIPTPTALERARPTETPRKMGRFMLELYVGRELLERVRFDLPMLDGDPLTGVKKRPFDAPPDFERKASVKTSIEVPDSERATFAVLVDRATGRRVRAPWPPVDAPPAASAAPSASHRDERDGTGAGR